MLESQTLKTAADTSWFTHDRFGLFIHWGLYALPARHEWVKSKERMTDADYDVYFRHFDPDLYDPAVWADAAADAGMKYFVVTTRHHDGFCLWDSAHTDYKVTNTPYGKDVLRPMVEAFRARGLRPGFYYSLLDWQHRDYVVDYKNHPLREHLPPTDTLDLHGHEAVTGRNYDGTDPNAGRDQWRYAAYMREQVRELLTQFGDIGSLWFDFTFVHDHDRPRDDFRFNKGREAWESEKLYKLIRELQPKVMLTDRLDLDLPLKGGDFKTPEQAQPTQWVHVDIDGKRTPVVWEACQTFSGSWGYYRDEHDWRSPKQLITTLIDCVSKGGNLLLNVGPTGRGELDRRALERLHAMGEWMRRHSRSIYGCTQAPPEFPCPPDCRLTYHPQKRRLYLHLINWPYKFIHLTGPGWVEQVGYAQLLHDASEVRGMDAWHAGQLDVPPQTRTIALPQREPDNVTVPVVEFFLKG